MAVAITQSVIGLLAILANAGMQTYGLLELNKYKPPAPIPDIEEAKKLLLGAILIQFISGILMITALILFSIHREKFTSNTFSHAILFLAGVLLLVGGSIGSTVSLRLQCYRSDANVAVAWNMATYSAIIGISGAILMLLIQAFVKRKAIKGKALQYLTTEYVPRATYVPVAKPAQGQRPLARPPQGQRPLARPPHPLPPKQPRQPRRSLFE